MLENLGHLDQPQKLVASGLPTFAQFTFDHYASYLESPKTEKLQVLWLHEGEQAFVSIFPHQAFLTTGFEGLDQEVFQRLLETNDLTAINVKAPWPLSTVEIVKPWGAEIWYTGIEARGVCTVAGIPLPWLTDLLPQSMIGDAARASPLLLKILAPLPDQNLGDLYFELHEKKIEVYVVTQVDPQAWPDGVGKIRYGFNPGRREAIGDDEMFRQAYLDAVAQYQHARKQIDDFLDQRRAREGFKPNQEIPPGLMRVWLDSVPETLTRREAELKETMNSFTSLRDIRVGDVITVEPYFPHSLQHGVRVVEFQTASYERHILSFAQKVLTQNHWDTEAGIAKAILDLPEPGHLPELPASEGTKVEVVADFSAFTALRITMSPGRTYALDSATNYQILIGVSGSADVGGLSIESETAFFIPLNEKNPMMISTNDGVVLLIAIPR